MSSTVRMRCSGCGAEVGEEEPRPFACPNATTGDDLDHVLVRLLDHLRGSDKEAASNDPSPFVRYRARMRSHAVAMHASMTDQDYVRLVRELDDAVAAVDGRGFRVTPFARAEELSDRLGFVAPGGVWVKDETGNVSGSHKGRHLMGLMIHLLVMERLDRLPSRPDLAIASCGNAALAAATVAAAARWPIQVFIPIDANPVIVTRLKELHAAATVCPRDEDMAGDPTYHRLLRAIAEGAIPFTCQGNLNGLAIEGGMTLGYEMADEGPGPTLDRVVVQVGGGALASACAQGLRESAALRGTRVPAIDTVQTEGAAPLARAHQRVQARLVDGASVDHAIEYAATHRSAFMWPWETEPHSVADGILDDETYDWFAVIRAMLETGGRPFVVDESALRRANDLATETTGIDVDHTGSAGLAGLVAMREAAVVGDEEAVAVLFTGARRMAGGRDA